MNLPQRWSVLNYHPESDTNYLIGVNYSKTSYNYTLYLTDLTSVWYCYADESKLKLQASEHGIQMDSISSIYDTLILTFEDNFKGSDTETHLSLLKGSIDDKKALSNIKLNIVKVYKSAKLEWSFDLVLLSDFKAISVFRSVIFGLSTVVFSLNEYKKDLIKQIENKDSAIRYLSESIDGLDASHIIQKWAPENSSNARTLSEFNAVSYDTIWKQKKLTHLENQYIWDILNSNTKTNTWSYGASFKEESNKEEKKELLSNDNKRSLDPEPNKEKRPESPMKKRRLGDLKNDFQEYDLMKESINDSESSLRATEEDLKSNENIEITETPKEDVKKKRGFGVSRKRKIAPGSFSPIKAPKHFQSND